MLGLILFSIFINDLFLFIKDAEHLQMTIQYLQLRIV